MSVDVSQLSRFCTSPKLFSVDLEVDVFKSIIAFLRYILSDCYVWNLCRCLSSSQSSLPYNIFSVMVRVESLSMPVFKSIIASLQHILSDCYVWNLCRCMSPSQSSPFYDIFSVVVRVESLSMPVFKSINFPSSPIIFSGCHV